MLKCFTNASQVMTWCRIICRGTVGIVRVSNLVARGRRGRWALTRGLCPLASGAWLLALAAWLLAPGAWLLTPGPWLLAPGAWLLVPFA